MFAGIGTTEALIDPGGAHGDTKGVDTGAGGCSIRQVKCIEIQPKENLTLYLFRPRRIFHMVE